MCSQVSPCALSIDRLSTYIDPFKMSNVKIGDYPTRIETSGALRSLKVIDDNGNPQGVLHTLPGTC
jgi:hypothetical protein